MELNEMIEELSEDGKQKGLNINVSEIEIIWMKSKDIRVKIDEEYIKQVREVVYLGQNIWIEISTGNTKVLIFSRKCNTRSIIQLRFNNLSIVTVDQGEIWMVYEWSRMFKCII